MLTFLKQNRIIDSDLAPMLDVGTRKGGAASIFVVAHHFSQSLSQLWIAQGFGEDIHVCRCGSIVIILAPLVVSFNPNLCKIK